mgnify:CR=1 FL=1
MSDMMIVTNGLTRIFGERQGRMRRKLMAGTDAARVAEAGKATLAVRDVSIAVPAGAITAIAGQIGSGKSTLLAMLSRLVEPTAGEIRLDGLDVTRMGRGALRRMRREKLAVSFQGGALAPHLSVIENAVFGLAVRGVLGKTANDKARVWMRRLRIDGLEERYPPELTDAERQKIGLVRALATDAPLLLLDEPFAALKPAERELLATELRRLVEKTRAAVVMTTGDIHEALAVADHVVVLDGGRVAQAGRPAELLLAPASDFVRNWTADANRARLIRASDVMEPLASAGEARGPAIAAGKTIGEAARIMADSGASVGHVTGDDGPVGVLKLARVVAALQPVADPAPDLSKQADAPPQAAPGA